MDILFLLPTIDIVVIAAFGFAKLKLKPKVLRGVSLVTLILYLASVLYITVFSRQPVFEIRLNIIPLQNFELNFYRDFLPNVLIFIPIGLLVNGVLLQDTIIPSILISIGISIGIEFIQLFYHVGICDIDDLIANSFGGVLGVLSARVFRHSSLS